MNKKTLTERDICTQFITPAVVKAGWDLQSQVRKQVYFTKGRIIVRGKMVTRGKRNFADYLLYYSPNVPIALIEAKDNDNPIGGGMQQALEYTLKSQRPFCVLLEWRRFYLSRPHGDNNAERKGASLDSFPSPQTLWAKYRAWKELTSSQEQVVLQDYFDDGSGRSLAITSGTRLTGDRGDREGPGPRPARHGDGHGEDVHRVPDHLAAVEGGTKEARPLPCRPQRPHRPDDGQRLPSLQGARWRSSARGRRPSSGRRINERRSRPASTRSAADRQVLRDLPWPLPGDHRARGEAEAIQAILAGFLRPHRRRRVPPRERG